ncbi:SNF2 family N-terminal domain-containing protein [Lasiosphaeria miniovina]|uniref:SNF2 family N-terminal domain-containing protein n=1 Tax=Lasiosphaeria miniovina TaxID=1954250 RepID=A0AA40A573_9PEZI|nr:SNF2 family N-terminal domain-containing protein [Lasiosphaeria miniovina]KAK0709538.1 SNF2 family N-terminal domain-containing protein [Lasiosphaeria miniovina]
MRKPGANFAFQPKNDLASTQSLEFDASSQGNRRTKKTKAELRQSFYDLLDSTTISYPASPAPSRDQPRAGPESGTMPLSRSPSFGDDDLELISSQTANLSIDAPRDKSPLRPIHNPNDEIISVHSSPAGGKFTPANRGEVIDISNSPATATPTFGHPTQLPSNLPKRKNDHSNLFIQRTTHPEFHRDLYRGSGPLKPKTQGRKAPPLQMFSSMGENSQPVTQYSQPASSYTDQVFYTDPAKANADLKALLEGGLDEDEDDENGEGKDIQETIDDGTLKGIKVKLLPHQVEGVTWMRGRELGPVKKGKVPKGGILADDMGLGKTLQSISLILSNPMPCPEDKGWKKHFSDLKKATLVVAPLALIRQWEAEIKDKVEKDHALKVYVHHGPQRTKDPRVLCRYDVVITTYQILVSEYGHSNPDGSGLQAGCFGVHWFRVILDEAHSIKNRNAKATKAVCALRAEYRWCLTGTPMQNNLDELQSLVHFLRVQPYDNLAEWRAQIDAPMKNGKGHIAIRRLHSLLRCFMKRRTKDILKEEGALVAGGKKAMDAAVAKAKKEGKEVEAPKSAFKITERKVVTVETELSPAEREFYDQLEERADASLEKMMKGKVNYANALVLLLRLRQACNHPRLTDSKIDKDKDALATDAVAHPKASSVDADLDDLADAFGGMGIQTKQCDMCLGDLSRKEAADGFLRCAACTEGLEKINSGTPKQKSKKDRRVSIVKEEIKIEKIDRRRPRNRKIITDSDDEDEEAEGSWIIPEDKRGPLRLGKAGGTDDENAEGGGEDLGADDSDHSSEAGEDDGSQLHSFIVNDEAPKDEPDSDSGSDDDTFVSVSKIHSQAVQQQRQESRSESGDSDQGISESELGSSSESDDSSRPRNGAHQKRHKKSRGKNGASQVMVSAKIRELLSILRKEAGEHKFIVFSQFTSMLDMIEPFLRAQPGLKAARYDGKMANDAREAALHALRTDPHTRVLLCSLKCGSLGLNLTAATRVVIVEPFWNPFVEEQAIDRVHRLTQTTDVVVYKLTVAQTVEARILELQNKKRLLAEATIEGGMRKKDKNAMKVGLQEILDLFKHDARHAADDHGLDNGDFVDPRVIAQDVGAMISRKPRKKEDEIYGRRW